MSEKIAWRGVLISVQPRIRLTRSFDQRQHSYLGYVLGVRGTVKGEPDSRDFLVAIGEATQAEKQLKVGDEVSGESERVADPQMETAEFYKATKIEVRELDFMKCVHTAPPFHGIPPSLTVYRERGHRRLAAKTYEKDNDTLKGCSTCIWGCRMPVEMIVDHWNPSKKRYRVETFCYGPKSCPIYKAGPPRKVPGRKGMSWTEEDSVDEDATAHRGPDE